MNNSAAILKALIIYAICIPLAIVVGYVAVSVANVPTYENFIVFGVLVLLLCVPILLRWHHPLLLLSWNLPISIFFLPGKPPVYLPMLVVSLGISVLQRTMNKDMRFLRAPQITLPLVLLGLVALVTAQLTGGIGLHSLGNPVMGGKKYIFLFAGILGFFALTARQIPANRIYLYTALFLLSGCFSVMGDLVALVPSSFYFIFLIIPPDLYAYSGEGGDSAWGDNLRFAGVGFMSSVIFTYMLARYGITGIFRSGKLWRLAILALAGAMTLAGGFRSALLDIALLFSILFLLEGLHRTKLLPILIFGAVVAAMICFPMSERLPYTFQRTLSFVPGVKVNPGVRADAQASLDWRLDMWRALLPHVPSHLILGKGYAITAEDYQMMGRGSSLRSIDPAQQSLALSSDYHSGPLSVILPLGIWGAIAFVWFLIAGIWALHHNLRYGDPALQTINTFLLAAFLAKVISFMIIFGDLAGQMAAFTGYLGLSVSLNGGIRRPARNPAASVAEPSAQLPKRPRWHPVFQR